MDTDCPACAGGSYGSARTHRAILVRAFCRRLKATSQLRVKVSEIGIPAGGPVSQANDEDGREDDEDDDEKTGKTVTDQVFGDKMCIAELHGMITLRCIFYCRHPNASAGYRRL